MKKNIDDVLEVMVDLEYFNLMRLDVILKWVMYLDVIKF